MTFEAMVKKISAIVEELESGTVSLEKAIKLYHEGMKYAKECLAVLEKSEKKIQLCVKDKKGVVTLKDFKKEDDAE